ncbi:hypothetical protein CTEN210_16077 [Chaetoceros tenuissimus]|uniref:Uncharacterized protein n=1 Tax=Chaetoceros tenuissimus TaxID=426638 RepID=A0AAD3DAD9_9STRA|nr:hypothetical protein CTEN210_16077 [Chaetoceros tenuissimus]
MVLPTLIGTKTSFPFRNRRQKSAWKYIVFTIIALATLVALYNIHCLKQATRPLYNYYSTRKSRPLPISKNEVKPSNDVLTFDEHVMENILETYRGAKSYTEWAPQQLSIIDSIDDLRGQYQTIPLHATVDRRPLIVRKQLMEDKQKWLRLTANGNLLGCAMTGSTFVSNLEKQYLKHYKKYRPMCDICFQFSNREDMTNFVPTLGYELLEPKHSSIATKCFGGEATVEAKFAKWQQNDARFKGYGYQWQVDCVLPNGIPELTCREISRMQKEIDKRDDLRNIYFKTKIEMDGWFSNSNASKETVLEKRFLVFTEWPWTALMSHDDDRSAIANNLSMSWNDVNSKFIPITHKEMTVAHVEGPGYDKTQYNGSLSLKSMNIDEKSKGGIHPRLVTNLFHLIRNAPGFTHMIAVVDGQAQRTYQEVVKLLNTSISDLYKVYGERVFGSTGSMELLLEKVLIPMDKMRPNPNVKSSSVSFQSSMTLMELLRIRNIRIHIIPIITPSIVFEKTVCGGQYTFMTYLAARYAADYQVIMFLDSDTAIVEGHRMRLIEQYVKPENNNIEKVLQCTQDLALDKNKWKYAMENCHLAIGHIVARSDSIYALSVHHPDTLPEYLPKGVDNCITPHGVISDRFYIREDEFVQLHLRDRERQAECACFINEESTNVKLHYEAEIGTILNISSTIPRKGDPIIAGACDILLKKQHLAKDGTNGRKIAFLQAGLDVDLLDAKKRKNKLKLLREMYKRKKAEIDEEEKMMAEEKKLAESAGDRNSTVEFPVQSPPAINRSSQQSESISVTINIKSLKPSKKDRKGYRLTSKQVISIKAQKEREKRLKELAYREGVETLRHERETKGTKAKSAPQVATEMKQKYGVAVCASTLNKRIKNGKTELYAGWKGRRGNIPLGDYCALKAAFLTAVLLHQAGKQHEFTQAKWKTVLQTFLHTHANGISAGKNLYERLIWDTAIAFTAEKEYFVELRRQVWTNSLNIDVWFSGFKETLINLGFATDEEHVDEDGNIVREVTFKNGQTLRIVNLDETSDDLGEEKESGGRPATTLISKGVNRTGSNRSSNNSSKTTFIVAHNAAGEVGGIHIQFASDAKDVEDQKVSLEWLTGLPRGRGRFGFDEERDISPTFGTNEKGGMDSQSFFEYLKNNIITLYPDAEDVEGKRVIIKCDGGPGRLDWDTLVYLRRRGFYLFPTVPNATSIMQELDQSFGYFKQLTRKNQAALLAFLTETEQPVRIQRSDLSIILNGDEKVPNTVKAFDIGFSKERNLQAWAKVGAVPLTRACLQDPSVMKILENQKEEENERVYDVTSPNFQMKVEDICMSNDLKTMEIINKQAVSYLNRQGWKGDVLLRKAPQISDKLKEVAKVKGKTSEQIIQDLGNSKRKHGTIVQTGGMALNCDVAINAGVFRVIQMEKKRRLDEHKEKKKAFQRQEKAKIILTNNSSGTRPFNSNELKDLIAWRMEGKGTSKFVSKIQREAQWEKVKGKNVPSVVDPGSAPFDEELTHVPSNVNESMKLLANETRPSQYWDMEVLPSGIVEVQEEDVLKKEVAL